MIFKKSKQGALRTTIESLLMLNLSKHWRKVNAELIETSINASQRLLTPAPENQSDIAKQILRALNEMHQDIVDRLDQIESYYLEFNRQYHRVFSEEDQFSLISRFTKALGYNRSQLRQDRKSFGDTLDQSTIIDRYLRLRGKLERDLSFILERIGTLSRYHLKNTGSQTLDAWKALPTKDVYSKLLNKSLQNRVKAAVLNSYKDSISQLSEDARPATAGEKLLNNIFRYILDHRQDDDVRIAAIRLLPLLSEKYFVEAATSLHSSSSGEDSIYVKYVLAEQIGKYAQRHDALAKILIALCHDSSAYVRQCVTKSLPFQDIPVIEQCSSVLMNDSSVQVKLSLLVELIPIAHKQPASTIYRHIIETLAQSDSEANIMLCIFECFGSVIKATSYNKEVMQHWISSAQPICNMAIEKHPNEKCKRAAYECRELCWIYSSESKLSLFKSLSRYLESKHHKKIGISIPDDIRKNYSVEDISRVLAVLAIKLGAMDLSVNKFGIRIYRTQIFRMRLWRIIYELFSPQTDKRQGFRHTIGRAFYGNHRIPSRRNSEMSETKVPGEPLFIAEAGSWRPFLPLLDDFYACLDLGILRRQCTIVTNEGKTVIKAPLAPVKRLNARLSINLFYSRYANLRNWSSQKNFEANQYIDSMRSLGFDIKYVTHKDTPQLNDSSVNRYFAFLPLNAFTEWSDRVQQYFLSVYENTINELIAFLILVSMYFFGSHIYQSWQIRYWRNHIPMVIGGWGTRGKSGTERLKAALMNALGFNVMCKTTGCEATFLVGYPYGELHEMFIFRPYDKATIWEQKKILSIASSIKTEVFLWECMALRPNYVTILQKQWMRDDISTITNTYPDHEDVQGPAGWNVTDVIKAFIPENATLITTEQEMVAPLRLQAKQNNTQFEHVSWLDAALITDDVLATFPYQEHPSNIALVLSLADNFSIDTNYALKEMSKRVVPDLGVLKTYPVAELRHRKIQFINGMAANERLGTLSNWNRLAFDNDYTVEDCNEGIIAVVNNRADRVARSKVFSAIMVNDIAVDKFILIGSNLSGLLHFIWEEWEKSFGNFLLDIEDQHRALEKWQKTARKYRVATSKEHVEHYFSSVISSLSNKKNVSSLINSDSLEQDIEELFSDDKTMSHKVIRDIISSLKTYLSRYKDYVNIEQAIINKSTACEEDASDTLRRWFTEKLVVVDDTHASGEEIINITAQSSTPGLTTRIMGLQNIKGPGLDFAYQWQRWDTIYSLGQRIRSGSEQDAQSGIHALVSIRSYNNISLHYLGDLTKELKSMPSAQSEILQSEIAVIEQRLLSSNKEENSNRNRIDKQQTKLFNSMLQIIESFFDVGDSVRRQKKANKIYDNLAKEVISLQQAADALKELNARQKGGWLVRRSLQDD